MSIKFITRKIKHVDLSTDVMARGYINEDNEFIGEYRLGGMDYGCIIPLAGCEVDDHDLVPILGYENAIIGEQCRQCGKEFFIRDVYKYPIHNKHFKY